MRVIFLDIDGVLNKTGPEPGSVGVGTGGEQPVRAVEEEKVRLLAGLAERTKAKIVLHSGWRFLLGEDLRPVHPEAARLVRLLDGRGLSLYGVTPDLTDEEIRRTKKFSRVKAREILLWLAQHEDETEKISWIVLDDLDLGNERVAARQIRTDVRRGLTEADVEAAVRLLCADGL